jgi:hypothetical protein
LHDFILFGKACQNIDFLFPQSVLVKKLKTGSYSNATLRKLTFGIVVFINGMK